MKELSEIRKAKIIQASISLQTTKTIEANSLGFGAKCLIAACLPYRNPKPEQLINGCWVRQNGYYTLWVQGGVGGIPYGSYPRLFTIFLTSEVIRTKSRYLTLGKSFRAFCHLLGVSPSRGKSDSGTRLIEQIDKFLEARIAFNYSNYNQVEKIRIDKKTRLQFTDQHQLFWDYSSQRDTRDLESANILLSEAFYEEITKHHVPIDMRAVAQLKQSALALDIYQWLAQRMYALQVSKEKAATPTYEQLNKQFGASFTALKHFKAEFIQKLRLVKTVYPEAKIFPKDDYLLIQCSPTPVSNIKLFTGRGAAPC